MYKHQIKEINNSLAKTGRAIIGLGCSFVQGQGAVNQEFYSDYAWNFKRLGAPLELDATDDQKKQILAKYPSVSPGINGVLDFTNMEYDNSFVSVLCKKYFNGSYTPINLGLRGCGNRATIKELYFHPDINWHLAKEIIVIYCPSGLERFDFINDTSGEHYRWKCMWPHPQSLEDSGRKSLWEGYAKTLWSEKFGIIEQLAHAQELLTWCNLKNARLVITPAFDRRFSKEVFADELRKIVRRDDKQDFVSSTPPQIPLLPAADSMLIDLFPWANVFRPAGNETFADLAMDQEDLEDTNDHFFQFLGKGSPDHWITSCAHPSAKAHDLFASLLYNHLT